MLSEKRAESVKQSLIEQFNIPAEKLSSIGYGEEMPVADNATADGRALNRRVEVGCAP
jgi:OOP family OmpA-OmpF porin